MISKIFIIKTNGDLCYSKTLFEPHVIDNDIIEYLTAFDQVGKKLGGGNVESLHFTNFKFVYSYDEQNHIYIMITDTRDNEEEVREKLNILKEEFYRRYKLESYDWTSKIKKLKEFDEFTEKYIFLPPKMLLMGEDGVGKTSIMDLFPGETILELDNDMNEIIQKRVAISSLGRISEIDIREINIHDVYENSKMYKPLLDSVDIICIVINSGSGNLSRTKNAYLDLRQRVKKADFYVIANFQDLKNSAFEPERISESFGLRTFGFSAIEKNARKEIYNILNVILENSLFERSKETLKPK